MFARAASPMSDKATATAVVRRRDGHAEVSREHSRSIMFGETEGSNIPTVAG